jgi:hypothetical protein
VTRSNVVAGVSTTEQDPIVLARNIEALSLTDPCAAADLLEALPSQMRRHLAGIDPERSLNATRFNNFERMTSQMAGRLRTRRVRGVTGLERHVKLLLTRTSVNVGSSSTRR